MSKHFQCKHGIRYEVSKDEIAVRNQIDAIKEAYRLRKGSSMLSAVCNECLLEMTVQLGLAWKIEGKELDG